ncbi:nucleoside 2-deoxyribosyltransferase [Chelatococcus sambhunathii]|uniref:Nucleoside 2-deoxyribosyltransferase n=1 Tax=Chelatococcus sambhunathii TaxID=363953 RepID=A0ABU1DED4_9HYPH|nr:nucleoside 2-deoxyribosyltransferase [Chelatococcus sambhunathii]MDR4306483.1 nucleoside 2-deoxyribosyltransferase [Chelatococcus sambhunathii]
MRVYLAGPEVFLADAVAVGAAKKDVCRRHGLEGLYPLDQSMEGVAPDRLTRAIFAANVDAIRRADAVIANLSPFRGIGADAGTVWEVGFAFGLGKPTLCYSNDPRPLFDRTVEGVDDLQTLADGRVFHPDGMSIENFGLADNLMIEEAIADSGSLFLKPEGGEARDLADLALFETCVRALAERREGRPRLASA